MIITTMENQLLTQVALRYRAIYLDIDREHIPSNTGATVPVLAFVARLRENGFCLNEEALRALSLATTDRLSEISTCIAEVMGVELNWAPLVKGWDVPTGETQMDHLMTFVAHLFKDELEIKGTTLPCGHLIPEGTFPLERYNGCPFCGTPFETSNFVYKGQGSKLKELRLFTRKEMENLFCTLLSSTTPLDATQKDSLEKLLQALPLPAELNVSMKETAMIVIKYGVAEGKAEEVGKLLKTPNDILRYLWFEKTGLVQIIEPQTLIKHARRLHSHIWGPLDRGADAAASMKKKLKLKYDRRTCQAVARWINQVQMTPQEAAENMNPKRGMWVRMIRALRLGEYARKKGFEHLAKILDVFYKQNYTTWQGKIDRARLERNANKTLVFLMDRPGVFARSLFAAMLRFGKDLTMIYFSAVADRLPPRLLFSLANAAESYFNPEQSRIVRPITGIPKTIAPNKLLTYYSSEEQKEMVKAVMEIYRTSMMRRYQQIETQHKTIYIAPTLYQIPVSVGDRSTTIQDTSCALMGTRFPIEGNAVRLFLQWGKGMPAQHLDMDLSCHIALPEDQTEYCYFGNLTCTGSKHSGDIRSIPDQVGTAEYIELSLPELEKAGATYVTFTCNAYSAGALSPNLVVGWMDSNYPMTISEETGVAYDPSCVQHMVRISESNLSKGLVFGVLDVMRREIVWLEMPFTAQTIHKANTQTISALLRRLEEKLTIGEMLELKAKAQNLTLIDNPTEADEVYTYDWALNPAEVSLLICP